MKKKLIERVKLISTEYKFGDFFRNFIAVMLGIIITFAGSDWITERNTQKELEKSLQLVKSELLLNKETIQEMGKRVAWEQKAARYLFKYKNKENEVSQDSVNQYLPFLFQWSKFTFTNDAIEMLKTSSLIQKIRNKELALQIIKAYGTIKAVESSFEMYVYYKTQVQDEFNAHPQVKAYTYNQIRNRENPDYQGGDDLSEQLRLIFTLPEGLNMLQTIPNIISPQTYYTSVEEINKVVAAIDKEYN